MELEVNTLNLTQICRTCKDAAPQMRSLFEGYENAHQSPRIDEMLMACASVQVLWGDGLPAQICQICVEQLRKAFVFKNQVETTEASLKEYMKNVKVEIKQEPQNADCVDEVTENMDEDKEVIDMGLNDEKNNTSETSMVGGNDNDPDSCVEKITEYLENEIDDLKEVKEEDSLEPVDNVEGGDKTTNIERDARESSGDTTDSEYLPQGRVSPKIRRGRGRPRKNPMKIKVPGRGRGRPKIKKEDEKEYREFPCPACHEIFNSMIALNKHARTKHEGLKVYKCNVCNKQFRRANHLNRHASSHSTDKPYCCHLCTKSFTRKEYLAQHHKKSHEKSNEFECDICQRVFNKAGYLANHRASEHGIGEKTIAEKKYECPLCSKTFTTVQYRDIHVSEHNAQKEYQCRVCEKSFSKFYITEHMKYHDEDAKKYLCSECGQRFFRHDYLVIHMRRHRGEKPFKCKYCERGFPRTTDLKAHEKCHTGEKNHICTVCGKGCRRSYDLTVHMRIHTGEKPYQCTYCDAAFVQINDLKVHIRRHTGEKFFCELCSKSFLKKNLLIQHQQIVHDLDVESPSRRLVRVNIQENPDEPSQSA